MPASEPRTERRQPTTIEANVAEVVRETPHAVTLTFITRSERPRYRAGQFVTIDPHQFPSLQGFTAFLEEAKGHKERPRAYTMSSAPDEPLLAITVKDEHYQPGVTRYPALLSPLLVHAVGPGTRIVMRGCSGHFTLPDDVESRTGHLVHLCAGSGSVPNFSILKHALRHHPTLRQTFIYSNRTWEDVIFRAQLSSLAKEDSSRLRLVHTLTRQESVQAPGSDVRFGRIDAKLIRELVTDPQDELFYVCGPTITRWERAAAREIGQEPAPRFVESVESALQSLGVGKDRIVREAYG
jgi:3-ketosteroid 9alpha-monooxygenase subunit B